MSEEKKTTVKSLLTEDMRKQLAELLLNNENEEMVVICGNGDTFQCQSSTGVTAMTLGMLEMAKNLVMNDWLNPGSCQCNDQDGEE